MSDDDLDGWLQPWYNDAGEVIGVMDQTTADFLASTLPDPTQASLDAAFDGVTRVRMLGQRHEGRYMYFDLPMLDITDPADIALLAEALRIEEADEYGHCMCLGDQRLELWTGDQVVHTLGLHHWNGIRWEEAWKGDADIADPEKLANWLLSHGITEARAAYEQWLIATAEAARTEAVWVAAMPPSLRPLWPDGLWHAELDLDPARASLQAALPDPVAQVRALYEWYGSLRESWDEGFRQYEEVPPLLLVDYEIEVLLAAADTDAALLGGARFACDHVFEYRRAADRERYPADVRQRMLDAVRRQGIPNNARILERTFAK